ncbi:UNVERIFIED_CONTAM: Retrovirus-related Pol polyprotein from transposon RE1 [Sesamum latifolium]|uniref:Retrovirus-related Pol polyprotein from transposon RE1 n=1 Tax=Sesamum latifolium TaxID=2727402 RepID=A0AAW2XHV4_9LAMI
MSIFEYFLKVKNICAEISELDPHEKISEARMRRFLIRGLKKEYTPFVVSVQGWPNQPSVEELENLLSNQEALAKQMARSSEPNGVLFSKGKFNRKNVSTRNKSNENGQVWKELLEVTHIIAMLSNVIELHQHNGERVIVTADNSTYPVAKEGVVERSSNNMKPVKLNDVFRVPGEAYVKKASQTDKAAIWHARLGHLGLSVAASNFLEEVGGRHSFIIEYDFSRYCWVKFLKEKSEALSKFVDLKDTVEKEFGKKIKCLRSHNGGEFMSNDFFQFCNDHGIQRQMMCPDTPQQNGVSERKLAHLMSLLPEDNEQATTDDFCPTSNISDVNDEHQVERRSARERRQPSYLKDFEKKSDGTIDRYKARLVARGFSQNYGLDYEETFSPVAKMTTVRSTFLLLHLNVGSYIWQLDVKNAFLYGELDSEVFMEQPKGYMSKEYPHHVCRLKKAIYGLKQAPRAWYGKVAQYFIFCGFKVSNADSSLFIKIESDMHLLVLLYVDDMIITGNDEAEISTLKNNLSVRFEMKNLGEVGCFLGLEVERSDAGYFISQRSYAKDLLWRFSMGESKEKATPMEPHLKLMKDSGKMLKDAKQFRQLVGSLIYLTITKPEISYSVGVVSQFMQYPRTTHLDATRRILRYIKGSLDYGLLYKKNEGFPLSGFSDADWGGNANDRHSTSGYCFSTGSAVISWCSKKQSIVASSSTKAEYVAATMAAQECV